MKEAHKRRAVAIWLIIGVVMIIIQTWLGGVTRLTGSGLSITQWQPILGVFPPMNDKEWEAAFTGYKQIGQFKYMNSDFTLADFKGIFFWEWLHRFWARIMLAAVFIIGFVYFLIRRYFDREMIVPFIILFLLGGLQGAVGWIMVHSGLNDSHLYVGHIELSLHFIFAMTLACYTLWFALKLIVPADKRVTDTRLHNATLIVLGLLAVQLVYGAFMAGLKAAMAAPTWPTINGMLLPDSLWHQSITDNKINVHFIHRTVAYLLLVFITAWYMGTGYLTTNPGGSLLAKARKFTFAIVIVQVAIGIVTVINAPHIVQGKFGRFEYLAETHQMVAVFLLMSLIVNLYLIKRQKTIVVL